MLFYADKSTDSPASELTYIWLHKKQMFFLKHHVNDSYKNENIYVTGKGLIPGQVLNKTPNPSIFYRFTHISCSQNSQGGLN